MRVGRTASFILSLACALGLAAGAVGNASTAPSKIRGLAPLPGDAPVPLRDRPPGASPHDRGPSTAIFPPQQIGVRMNHEKHVKGLGLTCATCHLEAKTSTSSADSLLPKPTRCDGCHGSDHRDLSAVKTGDDLVGQCGFCHVGHRPENGNRVTRTMIPPPNLIFDHRAHVSRNIACQQCHGEVQNLELATRDQLPRMRRCFDCHQMPGPARGGAKGECTTCHLEERGLMKTEFASGKLVPPRWLHDAAHTADWIDRHRKVAANDSAFCSNCHSADECVDCHDSRVRPRRVHPGDWISMHPMAARQASPECTSCHQQQSFCVGCHQRAGVTQTGPYARTAGRGRFHPSPQLWTDSPRSSQHHSWEAERNLNACVSCHVERDCVTCHATAAMGGSGPDPGTRSGRGANPHPSGFRDRCRGALRGNARPCLVCHDPQDAKLLECR